MSQDVSIEGQSRVSEYECYKAHHSFKQLFNTFQKKGNGSEKVVCLVRDPGDVLMSAIHFLGEPSAFPLLYKFMQKVKLEKPYQLMFQSSYKKLDSMIDCLIHEDPFLPWLKTPWQQVFPTTDSRPGKP